MKLTFKKSWHYYENTLHGTLRYFGYSMTGHTQNQSLVIFIGYTASNGKSTLFKMFDLAFDIYTKQLNSNILSITCKNRHKTFTELIGARFKYVDEPKAKKILFKDR